MTDSATDNSQEKQMLQTLRKQIKKEQFEKAIDTCEKLLNINPDDGEILKVKIVCYINLKNFDSALDLIGGRDELMFEKAYCLYRKNDLEGTLSVCTGIADPKPDKVQNLMAQAYYKLHQYSEAVSRYENLATSAEEEVDSDLLTNYYASSISDNKALEALHAYPQDADSVGDCFDLLFNVACAYISSGHIAQAEITLQNALELCRSVLSEDGLSEEEIATESTAISLQKTFVDILLGRASQRSLDECREVLKNRKKSDELMAVAANNLAVLRGDKDLPDSLRRLRSTISSASEEKLTRSQLMDLRYNRCILLLHLRKVDECTKTLDDLDKMYGVTARSVIIRASIVAGSGDFEGCDKILLAEISRLETAPATPATASSIEKLSVVRVQSMIHRGLYFEAEQLLSSIESVRNTAAGISAMYQLKLAQCRQQQTGVSAEVTRSRLNAFLLESAKKLADADSKDDSLRVEALFKIASELQSAQSHREAAQVLELLLSCSDAIDSTQRLMATSLLAAALSRCDAADATRVAKALPQVDYSNVDAAALETAEIPRLFRRARPNTSTIADEAAESGEAGKSDEQRAVQSAAARVARLERRKAKHREAYLQKLQEQGKYDPARPVKPDPERWLPLKHRSYNKRGRKNRGKFVGGQGSGDGAQKDMQKLDAYARVQAAAAEGSSGKKSGGVVIEAAAPMKNKKSRKKK